MRSWRSGSGEQRWPGSSPLVHVRESVATVCRAPRFQEEFPAKLTKQRFEFPCLNENTFGVGFESPILQSLVQCARVDPALSPKTPSLLLPVEEVPGKVRKRRWRSGKASLWYPAETLATGFRPKPWYTPPFRSDQQSDSFLVLWVVG